MPKELNGLNDRVCHFGSQQGRVLTQVRAKRLGNEGGVRGAGPS